MEIINIKRTKNYNEDDVDSYVKILQKSSNYKHNNEPTLNKVI